MSAQPDFLTLENVLFLHEEGLARYGGSGGVRDIGLLDKDSLASLLRNLAAAR